MDPLGCHTGNEALHTRPWGEGVLVTGLFLVPWKFHLSSQCFHIPQLWKVNLNTMPNLNTRYSREKPRCKLDCVSSRPEKREKECLQASVRY